MPSCYNLIIPTVVLLIALSMLSEGLSTFLTGNYFKYICYHRPQRVNWTCKSLANLRSYYPYRSSFSYATHESDNLSRISMTKLLVSTMDTMMGCGQIGWSCTYLQTRLWRKILAKSLRQNYVLMGLSYCRAKLFISFNFVLETILTNYDGGRALR